MNKYNRLLRNCMNQMNSGVGNAEAFKDSLADLGRWVLTQYSKGKLQVDDIFNENEEKKIKDFINSFGENAEKNGHWQTTDKTFADSIANFHSKLSDVYKIYKNPNDADPVQKEVSAEMAVIMANLLIDLCIMCYHYDIKVGEVLLHRYEGLKI